MATIDYKQKIKDYMNSSEVDTLYKSMLNNLFPELKDSEDERIRKEIITYLYNELNNITQLTPRTNEFERWISWLEKQGGHAKFINGIQVGDKVTRNEDGVLVNLSQLNRVAKKDEKQGEQKLNVNDNAKEMFIKALERVEEQNAKGYKLTDCDKNSWWEDFKAYTTSKQILANSAKTCKDEQNPAWSEEDKKIVTELIGIFESAIDGDHVTFPYRLIKDYIRVLKSCLPQNIWKPSDEQMKILNEVLNFAANHESPHWNDYIFGTLNNLIRQLKKL